MGLDPKARPILPRISLTTASTAPALRMLSPIGNGTPPTPTSLGGSTPSPEERPRRNRTSKPKVKTGCNNCKHRRIKCDERRPGCTQCEKARKDCPGYPAPSRSLRSHEVVVIAPKPVLAAAPQNGSLPSTRPPIPSAPHQARRAAKLITRRSNEQRPPPPEPADEEILRQDILTLYRPASNLVLTGQDSLYFQLFRTHTAQELSGFFDSVFWTQTVLRECHYEAAIRHAVIALGALYKTLEQSSASPPGSPSDKSVAASSPVHHWQVAVRQYSEAIKSVVALSSQNQRSHRILLMASVLLACFDSFVGDHRQAIYQIQNGLRLLNQVRAERRPGVPGPVEDELVQMFTRLAIQAKSYDMAFHFPQPYVIRLTPETPVYTSPTSPPGSPPPDPPRPHIPTRFGSLIDARLAWDILCETMLRFTETLFAQAGHGPMGILPRALKQYGAGFKGELDAWAAAFSHILERRNGPGVSAQEKAGIAVLKMFQVMGTVLFLMTFHDSEAQFDVFSPQFRLIVDLATEVVGDEERRAAARRCPDPSRCTHRSLGADFLGGGEYAAHHVKPSFSADLGIVPPLYVVATKCRDPVIRRQAIQLLRSSSRREGMWDSQLSGLIGQWVSSIEEAPPVVMDGVGEGETGPGAAPGGALVPGDRRVMVRSVDFDLRSRFARLSVGTRGIDSSAPDERARETSIIW